VAESGPPHTTSGGHQLPPGRPNRAKAESCEATLLGLGPPGPNRQPPPPPPPPPPPQTMVPSDLGMQLPRVCEATPLASTANGGLTAPGHSHSHSHSHSHKRWCSVTFLRNSGNLRRQLCQRSHRTAACRFCRPSTIVAWAIGQVRR